MVRITISASKKKPENPPGSTGPSGPIDPPELPVEVSGSFKGIVTPDGGAPKEVEGTYSGTTDPDTGEFDVMGILSAPGGVTLSSVMKDGITVSFSSPRPVIQNFLGDWFIQAPVTISAISPAPQGSGVTKRHGAMVNPNDFHKQGLDGRVGVYDAATTYTVGTALAAGDSLLCSISISPAMTYAELLASQGGSNPRCISEVAVFTVVDTLPSVNTFRPAVCGTTKTLYSKSQVNYSLLPGLVPPLNPCDPANGITEKWDFSNPKQGMTGTWLDRGGSTNTQEQAALMPDAACEWYPVYRAVNLNKMAVYSLCNFADAQTLANRIIQYGIDMKGAINQTNGIGSSIQHWGGAGAGFGVGRILPFLYAGWLLEDTSFAAIVTAGSAGSPRFGEQFSYYYSTTPYSGYAAGYPASITGPNYPMMGDNTPGDPPYSDNHSHRDPNGKYNGVGGTNSDAGYVMSRYQACDPGGTGNQIMFRSGAYLYLQGRGMAGQYIWSHVAGKLGSWGNQAAIDYMKWWFADLNLCVDVSKDPASTYLRDVYQYGGSGNMFMKQFYDTYVA